MALPIAMLAGFLLIGVTGTKWVAARHLAVTVVILAVLGAWFLKS
jgi:hypothetical protein